MKSAMLLLGGGLVITFSLAVSTPILAATPSADPPACKVASYSVTDFQFTRISDSVALLVYRAQQETTGGGIGALVRPLIAADAWGGCH